MVQWKHVICQFIGLCLFISGLTACSAPPGSTEDGERWYMMNNCYSCHGLNGNDGKGPVVDANDLSFRRFISKVRDAGSPIMPRFPEEKISKQDVADMYAWLRTR